MSTLLHRNNTPIIPPERETITVYKDDLDSLCYTNQFGRVYDWESTQHVRHHPAGHSRWCMHRLAPPQRVILMGADWALHLHWQMHIADNLMASRVGDVITVAFDIIGPVQGCHHRPNHHKPVNRWRYLLYHMRWFDQDDYADDVLLGVQP